MVLQLVLVAFHVFLRLKLIIEVMLACANLPLTLSGQ